MRHRLELRLPSYGRNISDDDWQTIDSHILSTLVSAQELCRTRNYDSRNVSVEFDLSEIIAYGERLTKFHEIVYGDFSSKEKDDAFSLIDSKYRTLGIAVDLESDRVATAKHFAETALCDLFLAINLATPAAFDLYGAYFPVDSDYPHRQEVSFSNYLFEAAQLDGENNWPQPSYLELSQVWSWITEVRKDEKQLPSNRSEKALFSVLHMCKLSSSPELVIWIFYALETLLDTKIGENFRSITERTAIVLGANEDQKKSIKKGLRSLYNVRSSFVHGGLEIIHPLNNEMLDKRISANYSHMLEVCDFGFRLVFCLIQQLVCRNLTEMRFIEALDSSPMR